MSGQQFGRQRKIGLMLSRQGARVEYRGYSIAFLEQDLGEVPATIQGEIEDKFVGGGAVLVGYDDYVELVRVYQKHQQQD